MNQQTATHSDTRKLDKLKGQRIAVLALVLFVVAIGTACDSGGVLPPITVTFRESLLDSTRVMQVTNRSGSETLVIELNVYNDYHNQHGNYVFKVKPGETYEIGRLEMGWCFVRGERFKLNASGYVVPIEDEVP